jgi:hypothetical protein
MDSRQLPSSHGPFPKYIVHGHTPTIYLDPQQTMPDVRDNRCNVDTGAGMNGPLSAAIFNDCQTSGKTGIISNKRSVAGSGVSFVDLYVIPLTSNSAMPHLPGENCSAVRTGYLMPAKLPKFSATAIVVYRRKRFLTRRGASAGRWRALGS